METGPIHVTPDEAINRGLSLRVISEEAEVSSIADEWNKLCESCPESDIFQSAEYVLNWWAAYGRIHDLRVYAVRNSKSRLLGLLPAYLARQKNFRLGDHYELRFIGTQRDGSTGYFDLVAHPKDRSRVTSLILSSMLSERADWSVARLTGVPSDSPFIHRLIKEFQLSESSCDRIAHPIIELPPDWAYYLEMLDPGVRNWSQMTLEKLGFNASEELRVTPLSDGAACEKMAAGYLQFVKTHGKAKVTDADLRFWSRLLRDLISKGRAQAISLVSQDVPTATTITVRWQDTLYCLPVASKAKASETNLEAVVYLQAVKEAIKSGAKRCDFLESTKTTRDLATQTRESMSILVTRVQATEGLFSKVWTALAGR